MPSLFYMSLLLNWSSFNTSDLLEKGYSIVVFSFVKEKKGGNLEFIKQNYLSVLNLGLTGI